MIPWLKSLRAQPTSPTEFEKEWRPLDWSDERRRQMLQELNDFRPGTSKVNSLRILLHGPTGSGKSSFINSVNSVLQGRNTTDALANAACGFSFTLEYKTYKLKKDRAGSFFPFVFSDMKGMEGDLSCSVKTNDIISILQGHVSDGYTFNPIKELTDKQNEYIKFPSPDDKVHCLVSVLRGDNISLLSEGVLKQMNAVREKARELGIPQVIIMSMVDKACPLVSDDLKKIYKSRKIKDKMQECSNRLGVPMSCIFPVKNYSEEITTNTTVDILLLMAVTNIVHFANDYAERQYT